MDENGRDNKGPGVQGNYYENYVAYYSPTSRQILIGVNKEMFRMGREWHEGKSRMIIPGLFGSSANIRFLY